MKMLHEVKEPMQFPAFFTEEWLKTAISELDSRNLTPEQRMMYEITMSNNAIAMWQEKERTDKAVAAMAKAKDEEFLQAKKEAVIEGIIAGLDFALIARLNKVSIEFVKEVNSTIN
jgi:Txe/YoeB family toxin of Txe-Axe toxin-antitoxin module